MSITETEAPAPLPSEPQSRPWWRWLRLLVLILTAQYTLVLLVGICAAGALRALLLPQLLENFEAIAAALKHTPL